jgi:hypothetical protein
MTTTPTPGPSSKPPHPGKLMERIRRLANEGAYSWGPHVRDRLSRRDIDINDAVEVLRLGEIEGPIEPGIHPGEWKCKVTSRAGRSSRRLGVATVVIRDSHLFLMTVEWEDMK